MVTEYHNFTDIKEQAGKPPNDQITLSKLLTIISYFLCDVIMAAWAPIASQDYHDNQMM